MLETLVTKNRSYRAFDEAKPVTKKDMLSFIDLARKTASGMNKQPLRYRILHEEADINKMMGNCRFASALGIKLPPEGQRPTGFILIFSDSEAGSPDNLMMKDVGIAAQTILLSATEKGFGGCMLESFSAERMVADFDIPARYTPRLAIALGTPAELCVLTEAKNGSVSYFRDESGTHYVPKRKLEDILI